MDEGTTAERSAPAAESNAPPVERGGPGRGGSVDLRGGLAFEDLVVGTRAPVRTLKLTRTDLVRYAGASHDFNPLHHDDERARAAGLRGVFGHGMFSAGLLATALTDLVGIGNLRGYKVRFTAQAWPDAVLSTDVTVTGRDETSGLVELDCQVRDADGATVVAGHAVASPARRGPENAPMPGGRR